MVGASASIARPRKGIIFSSAVDLLVLGGMSMLWFALCQALDIITPFLKVNDTGIWIIYLLSLVVNQPHYSATYYRVYSSWRETRRYAVVSLILPFILLVLLVGSFFYRDTLAPWFCKAYFITVSYHYAGQTYGIALIFAHKAGIAVNRWLKVAFGLPIYGSALLYLIGDEVITDRRVFIGVNLPHIGFPSWAYLLGMWILTVGVFLYAAMCFYLAYKSKPVPLIIHIVVLSQILWFTIGLRMELFYLMVPFFHCLQYLLITACFRFKELLKSGQIATQTSTFNFFKSGYFIRYYLTLVVVGLVLFNGIPHLVVFLKASNYDFAYPLFYSFVNLHHFLLDGEIWKLRKPDIGKALLT